MYATKDIWLASALVSCGHTFEGIEDTGNGRKQFIFRETAELGGDVRDFINRSLRVDVRTLRENLKDLRGMIYEPVEM